MTVESEALTYRTHRIGDYLTKLPSFMNHRLDAIFNSTAMITKDTKTYQITSSHKAACTYLSYEPEAARWKILMTVWDAVVAPLGPGVDATFYFTDLGLDATGQQVLARGLSELNARIFSPLPITV